MHFDNAALKRSSEIIPRSQNEVEGDGQDVEGGCQ